MAQDMQMLATLEQKIEQSVKPQIQNAYQRIVMAGLKMLSTPQTKQIVMQQITAQGDPAQNISDGILRMLALFHQESKGSMPPQAAIPAMMTLMVKALQYLVGTGRLQLNQSLMEQVTQDTAQKILQFYGVTQSQMQAVMSHATTQMQDPNFRAQVKQQAAVGG